MGNCCGNQEEERPLLGSGPGPIGVQSGTLSTPSTATPSYVTEQPQSARQFRPVDQRGFETSIQLIAKVQLDSIPIVIIDKTFQLEEDPTHTNVGIFASIGRTTDAPQDSGKLYNEVVDNYRSLEGHIHEFKAQFAAETAGIPILATCVQILRNRCGDARLTIERKSKHFIDLEFDPGDVRRHGHGDPEQLLQQLKHFQSSCREIRNILEHAPQLEKSLSIVLNTEAELRKDIVKSDLSPKESQLALKAFVDNVSKLRVIAAGADTIKRDAEKKFKEFSKASQGFFTESDNNSEN